MNKTNYGSEDEKGVAVKENPGWEAISPTQIRLNLHPQDQQDRCMWEKRQERVHAWPAYSFLGQEVRQELTLKQTLHSCLYSGYWALLFLLLPMPGGLVQELRGVLLSLSISPLEHRVYRYSTVYTHREKLTTDVLFCFNLNFLMFMIAEHYNILIFILVSHYQKRVERSLISLKAHQEWFCFNPRCLWFVSWTRGVIFVQLQSVCVWNSGNFSDGINARAPRSAQANSEGAAGGSCCCNLSSACEQRHFDWVSPRNLDTPNHQEVI